MATNIFGTGLNTPSINIAGALSSSWIYVAVIGFFGLIFICGIGVMLFYTTYNRKIELYENISGKGYSRTKTVLARRI